MKFLRNKTLEKTVISISDLHLGAGIHLGAFDNPLEEFTKDHELERFLEYFSTGNFETSKVELVINGDFLDFLAVPYIEAFDDEYWSEWASMERLSMIHKGHQKSFEALGSFLKRPNKKLIYILGNHDGELILPEVMKQFLSYFPQEVLEKILILPEADASYYPIEEIVFKHGHEYEVANYRNTNDAIIKDSEGQSYYNPPWGSYYVVRVINKFKAFSPHIQSVRPIKKFLIHGLIYDALTTIRFIFANIVYFIMVRFVYFFKSQRNFQDVLKYVKEELKLFRDYAHITEEYFEQNEQIKALIVGHTHNPIFKQFWEGPVFINTGTWTRMHSLDFDRPQIQDAMTFAMITIKDGGEDQSEVALGLYDWKVSYNNAPYAAFF